MAEDVKKPEAAAGFLGRWSRRKTEVLQGSASGEPVPAVTPAPANTAAATAAAALAPSSEKAGQPTTPDQPAPALSLDDARLLNKDSDFRPFMAKGVGSDVRNAAMKKLFADPQFNVMDGLDTYIDDYSISEPIPESMLRQMVSAKFLKLFDDADDEKKPQLAPASREIANNPADETVAQSSVSREIAKPDTDNPNTASPDITGPENHSLAGPAPEVPGQTASQDTHANTDLRLQPDDAAPAASAGRGA